MAVTTNPFEIGRRTCEALRRLRIPPTPENYLIWYAHYSGEHPALSRIIRLLEQNGDPFDAERCRELYERFFMKSEPERLLSRTVARFERIMGELEQELSRSGEENAAAGRRIEALGVELEQSEDIAAAARAVTRSLLDETRRLGENLRTLAHHLHARSLEVNELRTQLEQARREAETDPLTGLANRKGLEGRLRALGREAMETGQSYAMLVLDIDHFKKFNDTYGHKVGDAVLRTVAMVLRHHLRQDDLAARYGGEEFVVLLPNTDLDQAREIAERIRRTIGSHVLRNRGTGEEYGKVTISAGVAVYRPGERVEELFERADTALYRAKQQGRNRVVTEAELSTQGNATTSIDFGSAETRVPAREDTLAVGSGAG